MTTLVEHAQELWERDELPDDLKWIDRLSRVHQRLFFGEAQYQWGRYCATKDLASLDVFFEDWKATAEVDADPEHAAHLLAEKAGGDYEEWKAAS